MESSLHRQLKERYGPAAGGRAEVMVAGYRIDAVAPDGELVEVQSGALGPLAGKLRRLLGLGHRVRVVKPVVVSRRIVKHARRGGPVVSARRSPRPGHRLDLFDDLVGAARWLAEPGLALDVLEVAIEERRVARRRRPGFAVLDRSLVAVARAWSIEAPADLWRLMDADGLAEPFTTRDLAAATGRPLVSAQRIAYCLRQSGAARAAGKAGRLVTYVRG